ncbi:unnamed protein product [Protopolystoma xenopodis]|uniref:Uncharacterized protein n=1 Tax=Protopolystoma xenopodis TaxID=117903 RepID=A0A448WHQ9_9PLAT|nr:unnamed protein product [Protopolystoma xenopodis]
MDVVTRAEPSRAGPGRPVHGLQATCLVRRVSSSMAMRQSRRRSIARLAQAKRLTRPDTADCFSTFAPAASTVAAVAQAGNIRPQGLFAPQWPFAPPAGEMGCSTSPWNASKVETEERSSGLSLAGAESYKGRANFST